MPWWKRKKAGEQNQPVREAKQESASDFEIARVRLLDSGRDCPIGGSDKVWVQLFLPKDSSPPESMIASGAAKLIKEHIPQSKSTWMGPTSEGYSGFVFPKHELRLLREKLAQQKEKSCGL